MSEASASVTLGSVLRWALGVVMALLAPLPAFIGYSAIACPNQNPLGWGLLTMFAAMLQYPVAGILFLLCALLFWPTMSTVLKRPVVGKVVLWWAVISSCIGLVSFAVSWLLGASARCSLLW